MTAKLALISMTAVAVVSDSLLHPFYPQYFAEVLGVTDPRHVGLYVAACSLTVLLSFPLWARLSLRVHPMRLLLATQACTGLCALACSAARTLASFWLLSLGMMVFKASYLLIYPHLMSRESKEQHLGTISLLAFVVYFGNILAALLSGAVFELISPRSLFSGMAIGDALQSLLCVWLLALERTSRPAPADVIPKASPAPAPPAATLGFASRLGLVMLVLYFSAYFTEPFFSSYWEGLSGTRSKIAAGLVYALPGVAALAGLIINQRRGSAEDTGHSGVPRAVGLAVVGLGLEATAVPLLVLGGRFLSGWALFQAMVRLDALLFRASTPESYSVDFSKANAFQGLGVLLASLGAGSLISVSSPRATFLVAALGFALGLSLYCLFFRHELWRPRSAPLPRSNIATKGIT
jgi:DHA1 family multidrug resistance protein-like MFS transporter